MVLGDRPIGVFDSGLGGLTVVRALRASLPGTSIVYLGDTARVPYGVRSASTVVEYAKRCARLLRTHDVGCVVVACNTVSAVALPMLREMLDVEVFGVVEPGARAGLAATRSYRIGVLATRGTVVSGAYERAVTDVEPSATVVQQEAPLLVPLAEEGWLDGPVAGAVIRSYLEPFRGTGVDTLVLGCTHYPLFRRVIEEQLERLDLGNEVTVVDSAGAVAKVLVEAVGVSPGSGSLRIHVTDLPSRFREVAARFLGDSVDDLCVQQVDLQ